MCDDLKEAGFKRDLRAIQRLMTSVADTFGIECDRRSKLYGCRWPVNSPIVSVPGQSSQEAG